MKTPQYICIHHTAYPAQKELVIDGEVKKPNPDQWKATDAYHKSKGWGGGGYNYEISLAGLIHQFRADGSYTAAQYEPYKGIADTNDGRVLSICLDGHFDYEQPSPAQMDALRTLIKAKMASYNIPSGNVVKHRDIALNAARKPKKSCPGSKIPDDVYTYFVGLPASPQPNTITLALWRHKPTGRIYLVKQGRYYPIADEAVFNLLFGSFGQAKWGDGDTAPTPAETGKALSLT